MPWRRARPRSQPPIHIVLTYEQPRSQPPAPSRAVLTYEQYMHRHACCVCGRARHLAPFAPSSRRLQPPPPPLSWRPLIYIHGICRLFACDAAPVLQLEDEIVRFVRHLHDEIVEPTLLKDR